MPMRGELPTIASRSRARPSRVRVEWGRFVRVVLDPELQTGVAFCVIGILVTLITVLCFPDFGALIVDLNSLP